MLNKPKPKPKPKPKKEKGYTRACGIKHAINIRPVVGYWRIKFKLFQLTSY